MWQAIKALLKSKKFLMTMSGVIVWAAGRWGLELTNDQIEPVLFLIAAFVLGQGIADHGKEAAKIASEGQAADE